MKATDLNITLAANLRAWRIYSQTPSARPTLFVPVALPLLSFVSAQQNINQKKKGPRQKVLAQGRAIVRLAYNTASQVHRLDAFLSLSSWYAPKTWFLWAAQQSESSVAGKQTITMTQPFVNSTLQLSNFTARIVAGSALRN